MRYSVFIIVCLIIHIVVNIDIFRKKATVALPAIRAYRVFVGSVFLLFVSDLLWGVFSENKLATALYVDNFIYLAILGFTVLAWARYLIKYLDSKGWFAKTVLYTGNLFFLAELILLIINIFHPILFIVDKDTCEYITFKARNILYYVQILMYFLLIVYTTINAFKARGSIRRRYMTITLFSIIMVSAIIIQIYFPTLPLYSIGLIIGSSMLNAFVISDIKDEYKSALEQSRNLVKEEQIKLDETKHIAYSDPLTGVKNKHAYVEEEERIDKLIAKGDMESFAVVVFDLNGLKIVNDTKGHDAGDVYIVDSCRTIEKYFGGENLYRFGGDEFVVILTGDKYKNRSNILNEFEQFIDDCVATDAPIISSGMSKYKKGEDNTYHAVFYRADKIMYTRKEVLKERQSNQ